MRCIQLIPLDTRGGRGQRPGIGDLPWAPTVPTDPGLHTCHRSGPRGWHFGGLPGCFAILSCSMRLAEGLTALTPKGQATITSQAGISDPSPANIIFPESWYWRQGEKQSHRLLLAKAWLLRTILFLKHTEGKQQYTREARFL